MLFNFSVMANTSLSVYKALCVQNYTGSSHKVHLNEFTVTVYPQIDLNDVHLMSTGRSLLATSADKKSVEMLPLRVDGEIDYFLRYSRSFSRLESTDSLERERSATVKSVSSFKRLIRGKEEVFVGIHWSDAVVQFYRIDAGSNSYGEAIEFGKLVHSDALSINSTNDLVKYFDDMVLLSLNLNINTLDPDAVRKSYAEKGMNYRPLGVIKKAENPIEVKMKADGSLELKSKDSDWIERVVLETDYNGHSIINNYETYKIERSKNGFFVVIHGDATTLHIATVSSRPNGSRINYFSNRFHKGEEVDHNRQYSSYGKKQEVKSKGAKFIYMTNSFGTELEFVASIWSDGTFVVQAMNLNPGFGANAKTVYTEVINQKWMEEMLQEKSSDEVINHLFNTYFREAALILKPSFKTN